MSHILGKWLWPGNEPLAVQADTYEPIVTLHQRINVQDDLFRTDCSGSYEQTGSESSVSTDPTPMEELSHGNFEPDPTTCFLLSIDGQPIEVCLSQILLDERIGHFTNEFLSATGTYRIINGRSHSFYVENGSFHQLIHRLTTHEIPLTHQ